MPRRPVDEPRWQHSDGRPYDQLDRGFTRFVDEADALPSRRRARRSRLRALMRFWHSPDTDTSRDRR
jgi:hypothetical protein